MTLLKLLLLPVGFIVTVMKWIGVFLTSFAGAILSILAGFIAVIAILSYLMEISTGPEAAVTLLTGIVVFILPVLAGWLVGKIEVLNEILWYFIKS